MASAISYPLEAASNVVITSVTDGQALVWDSSTSKWVNETVGGSSAPADATYVVASSSGSLPNSTVITAGTNITVTNAKGALTVDTTALNQEQVDDRVAALLVAGTNITLTYNDPSGTITIDAASGGVTLEQVDDHLATAFVPGVGIEIAYDDAANEFTFDRLETIATDTDGSTITFDLAADVGEHHEVTLGGNRTLAVTNQQVGQKFRIKLVQDATGGRTVTWWDQITWADGYVPALTPVAADCDLFAFLVTGSNSLGTTYLGWPLTIPRPQILAATVYPSGSGVTVVETIPGDPGYAAIDETDLLAAWKLDEDVLSANRSQSVSGTGVGSLIPGAGPVDTLPGIDGADLVWTGGNSLSAVVSSPAIANDDFTISMWHKRQSSHGDVILTWVFVDGSSIGLKVTALSAIMNITPSVGSADTLTNSTALTAGTWNLIVATWDKATQTLGLSVNGAARQTTVGSVASIGATDIQVSLSHTGNSAAETDEICVWGREMSNAEISALWAGGAGQFYGTWDSGTDPVAEVQTMTVAGNGTYTLTFNGETVTLNATDNAATIQAALRTITTLESVTVTGTGPFTITFPAALGNVALIVADDSGMTGSVTIDWSVYDAAHILVSGGTGTYTITHTNLIPGKRLLVTLSRDGSGGSFSWSSNVDWGTDGAVSMPADNKATLVDFYAATTTKILGGVIDDGFDALA